jgi:hypothetical protein
MAGVVMHFNGYQWAAVAIVIVSTVSLAILLYLDVLRRS